MAMTRTQKDTELLVQTACIFMLVVSPVVLLAQAMGGTLDLHHPQTLTLILLSILTWGIALRIARTMRCQGCSERIPKNSRVCPFCRFDLASLQSPGAEGAGKRDKFVPLRLKDIKSIVLPESSDLRSGTFWATGKMKSDCEILSFGLEDGALVLEALRNPALDMIVEEMEKGGDRKALFRMNLPTGNYFYKVRLGERNEKKVRLRVSGDVFKLERRMYARVPISKDQNVEFAIRLNDGSSAVIGSGDSDPFGKMVSGQVLDISKGGLGLFLGPEQGRKFNVGDRLRSASISLQGREIRFGAQVCHKSEYPFSIEGKKFKLGLCFDSITKEDREQVASFVLQQKRRYSLR